MVYVSYIPSPPLNTWIDDLYYVEGAASHARLKILPMPSLHLMVNSGDAFEVHEPQRNEPVATCTRSWLVGLWNRHHVVNYPRQVRFFGVHFKPGGAYPFLRLPLKELHNQVVSLDEIWQQDAAEIGERLAAVPVVEAGFALLEQFLLARLDDVPHGLAMVQYAIEEINRHHGTVSIRGLSECIGISQNHLETQFKRLVGVLPKELARLYRFAYVLSLVNPAQPVDWTHIAHQSSFYDQPHFNREFAAFTGCTPTDYLRLRRTEHLRSMGQLATD